MNGTTIINDKYLKSIANTIRNYSETNEFQKLFRYGKLSNSIRIDGIDQKRTPMSYIFSKGKLALNCKSVKSTNNIMQYNFPISNISLTPGKYYLELESKNYPVTPRFYISNEYGTSYLYPNVNEETYESDYSNFLYNRVYFELNSNSVLHNISFGYHYNLNDISNNKAVLSNIITTNVNLIDYIQPKLYETFDKDHIYPSEFETYINSIMNFGIRLNTGGGGVVLNEGLSLSGKYANKTNTFFPIIGTAVTNCHRTFFNCRNAIGSPIMRSDLVDSMGETFCDCWNLTGSAECGNNVKNMSKTFYNCGNLNGNIPDGPLVNNLMQTYWNCINLTGSPGVYPEGVLMYQTYYNCGNITGDPYIGSFVTNAVQCYENCYNLTGEPMCGDETTLFQNTYRNCYNITGNAVCGPKVTNMDSAYYDCHSLNGSPMCGNAVTALGFVNAYYNCTNLTGRANLGANITSAANSYYNCTNLQSAPNANTFAKVTTMDNCFFNCQNMRGTVFLPAGATTLTNAFANCRELGGFYHPQGNATTLSAAKMLNCFNRPDGSNRINIIFTTAAVLGAARTNTVTGCEMTAIEQYVNPIIVNLPFAYSNGTVYGYQGMEVKRGCFNTAKNIYMYSTT